MSIPIAAVLGIKAKRRKFTLKDLNNSAYTPYDESNDPDDNTPSLQVNRADPIDAMYEEWKKTGKISGQNMEFPNRNNTLYDTFKKRLAKEKQSNFNYPDVKKAIKSNKK